MDLDTIEFIGSGLNRPECVLTTAAGMVYSCDWRGGVAAIRPDGSQTLWTGTTADLPEGLRPNGIALEPDGSFLFANLGDQVGGLWRLRRNGQVEPILTEIDGNALLPSNFVHRDWQNRVWLTVSSGRMPRSLDFNPEAASGFIVLIDEKGGRIVADGLGFTNECLPDPAGINLYVVETYTRRLSRFPILPGNRLGPKLIVAEFGRGQFPDGMAFDADGNIWIAGIVSNQLIKVDVARGASQTWLEDSDPGYVAEIENAYLRGTLDQTYMQRLVSRKLRNISSIAFGGPDLRTGFLGCLLGESIARLKMPVAGHPPVHWRYDD